MRSRAQYTAEYALSHRHPVNQLIHLICVPAIFFSVVALGAAVPLGRLVPGLTPGAAKAVNLATIGALPVLAFYARLGASSFLSGLAWLAASLLLCAGIQSLGISLPWTAAGVFVVAWFFQFVGHRLEGVKPSFFDDLLFLLIGPLFVQDKLGRWLRGGAILPARAR